MSKELNTEIGTEDSVADIEAEDMGSFDLVPAGLFDPDDYDWYLEREKSGSVLTTVFACAVIFVLGTVLGFVWYFAA